MGPENSNQQPLRISASIAEDLIRAHMSQVQLGNCVIEICHRYGIGLQNKLDMSHDVSIGRDDKSASYHAQKLI